MIIAIINYGVGNLFSIKRSFERIGCRAKICLDAEDLKKSDAIVLPGVGNFMAGSEKIGRIKDALLSLIIDEGLPVLGICLGMHLLFPKSDEGYGSGLNIFSGRVVKLPRSVKIPHMGWNNLKIIRQTAILDGICEKSYFYFAHSYYASPEDKNIIAAETTYGISFPSVISSGNIFGVQFHPEKSEKPGEQIMRNFVKIISR